MIAIIIPTYNAEDSIVSVIDDIPAWIDLIIVVDDCSKDNTLRVIPNNPKTKVIKHEENQGVGGATISGYLEAIKLGASIMVKMDSDGQMNTKYLSLL